MNGFTPSPEQMAEATALKGQLDQILAALGKDPSQATNISEIHYLKASLGRRIAAHTDVPKASRIPGLNRQVMTPKNPLQSPQRPAPTITEPISPVVDTGLQLKSLLGKSGQPDVVSMGDEVALLQLLLLQMGYQVIATGVFDLGTTQAVRNLQLKAKLPVTSVIDAKTRDLLNPRLEAWKKQLGSQLGKAPQALSLSDIESTRKRKTGPLPELSGHMGQTGQTGQKPERVPERIFGPNQPSISEAPEIELIHRVLKRLALPAGKSSRFDAQTYAGVRKFQASSRLKVTGLVDSLTFKALAALDEQQQAAGGVIDELLEHLREHSSALNFSTSELKWKLITLQLQVLITQLQSPLPPGQSPLDLLPDLPNIERPLLSHELGPMGQASILSQGLEVERLQETLQTLGYEIKSPGHYDLQTLGEVRRFQQAQGISPSGQVDAQTRAALNIHLERRYAEERFYEGLIESWKSYLNKAHHPVSGARWQTLLEHCERILTLLRTDSADITTLRTLALPERLSEDLSPDKAPQLQVLLLQFLLSRAGLETTLTGHFDAETTAHVRSFQTQHKLPMTGRVDSRTREHLNKLLITTALFD